MAINKIIMKKHNGTTWDEMYPKTSSDQVEDSASRRFVTDDEKAAWTNKANATHSHTIADVVSLQSSLDSKAEKTHSHATTDITGLQAALDGKAATGHKHTLSDITDAGTAASKNAGNSSGNVPLIGADGKLDAGIMPAIAITDTFVVANEAAMLALDVQKGDVAVRQDLSKSFILKTEPATVAANWQELITPTSPVQSVAGKTGTVTLAASDVGLGNVTNESKATMFTNPALTGVPTAPTPAVDTNTTQVATTAYVKSQGYATLASPALTGTPKAPTAATTSNDTQIATTAFVKTAVSQAVTQAAEAASSTTVSNTAPTAAKTGDLWFEVV